MPERTTTANPMPPSHPTTNVYEINPNPTPRARACVLTLTQTNSRGYIAICAPCGWTSAVHPSATTKKQRRNGKTVDAHDYDIGKEAATAAWRAHKNAEPAETHEIVVQRKAA